MTKANCIKVEYQPGECFPCQGGQTSFVQSLLLLHANLQGKHIRLEIGRFFKEAFGRPAERIEFGRLTCLRRELIARTMPAEITVKQLKKRVVATGLFGDVLATFGYEADKQELRRWFSRISVLSPEEIKTAKAALPKRKIEEELAKARAKKQAERSRERRWEREQEKRIEAAPKLTFVKGRNPKYGTEQWEVRHEGRLYVLRREDDYEPSEGQIPVEEVFELVPGRVVLVERF